MTQTVKELLEESGFEVKEGESYFHISFQNQRAVCRSLEWPLPIKVGKEKIDAYSFNIEDVLNFNLGAVSPKVLNLVLVIKELLAREEQNNHPDIKVTHGAYPSRFSNHGTAQLPELYWLKQKHERQQTLKTRQKETLKELSKKWGKFSTNEPAYVTFRKARVTTWFETHPGRAEALMLQWLSGEMNAPIANVEDELLTLPKSLAEKIASENGTVAIPYQAAMATAEVGEIYFTLKRNMEPLSALKAALELRA